MTASFTKMPPITPSFPGRISASFPEDTLTGHSTGDFMMTTVVVPGWPWKRPKATVSDRLGGTWNLLSQRYDWIHFWRRQWYMAFGCHPNQPDGGQ